MPSAAARSTIPLPAEALPRLARRLSRPVPASPWAPPPLTDLIARIDDALAQRRQ